MNVALLHRQDSRPSADLFAELLAAVEALPAAMDDIGRMATDRDRLCLERLERLGERFGGLARAAMLLRTSLANELASPEQAA